MSMPHPGGAYRSYTREDPLAGRDKLVPGTIPRVIRFARPYTRQIALFLLLVVISAGLVVASPLLFKTIVDRGILRHDESVVVGLSGLVAVLAVFEAVLTLAQRWYSARIGEGLIYDLRVRVFDHVQQMPLAFFARAQTGSLVSRLNTDIIGAQSAFTTTLQSVVANVVSLALVVGTMLLLSWQITVVSILLLPLFLLPAKWAGRRLAGMTREQMQTNADVSSLMAERFNVGGASLMKLFGRPQEDLAEYAVRAGRVRDLGVRIAMTGRIFFAGLALMAALATALVYGVGGHFAIAGSMSIGTLLALVALLGRLYGPMTSLSNVRVDIMTALVSFERVFELLDLEPMIQDRPDAQTLRDPIPSIEFRDVGFTYPRADEVSLASLESINVTDSRISRPVLHDVHFQIEPGQLVALVGPTGAGKTTITHLVARLYDVTSGAVLVGGVDVRDVTQESLHDVVGYVTQDAQMFHDTMRANLLYARPDASDAQLEEVLRAAQIWNLVASLPDGLDTVVGDRGYRLSGGERQRLAIARMLLKAPGIVVLDEATAHLDSESEVAVQRALDEALSGRTSLVIAHRLSTVRNADLILVLDQGRIVERGTHQELLASRGLYSDLYRTQFAAA
jgi:ATP-binding cassette, subfamily B, bacterial